MTTSTLQRQQQKVDNFDDEGSTSSALTQTTTTSTASSQSTTSSPPHEVTTRTISLEELEVFNFLTYPIWIFDFPHKRNRWANHAGLKLWNADNLQEFLDRDMSDMSPVAEARTQDLQNKIDQGQFVDRQWTFYPKGKAKTVHTTVRAMRLAPLEDGDEEQDDGYNCMFVFAIPLVKQNLLNETLRGVEMVRHLPMAVCQFDMDGKVMFQNPAAQLPPEEERIEMGGPKGPTGDDMENREVQLDHYDKNQTDSECRSAAEALDKAVEHEEKKELDVQDEQGTAEKEDDGDDNGGTASNETCGLSGADGFLQRFVNPHVAKESLEAMKSGKAYVQLNAELYTTHGRQWSEIQLRKTHDPVTGEPVILYSAQDKSDAMEAKRERQASIQKSEFLAIMAHEIRTPLHQVTGFIDLLDQTTLDKEQKNFVKLLKSSAHGLMTVINDVLDYSKLEAGKMKIETIPYEPNSVVLGSMAAVRTSCEEKKLTLTCDWSPNIPFKVLGDPNRLRQILLNLLSNAVKFTKTGGIHVQAKLLEAAPPERRSSCSSHDNTIEATAADDDKKDSKQDIARRRRIKIAVTDTGMGICKEHRDLIFQKYQQGGLSVARNYGGTGLGLSICQLLVQTMGGSIGVDSQLGQGSSFWFILPVQEVPNTPQNSPTQSIEESKCSNPANDPSTSGLNILVAEDNKINQKLVVHMLKRLGHQSTIAENGKEAIDLVLKQDTSFDVVLMDVQMPVMDGLEATRRLRTLGFHDLPIYGLTASVKQADYVELGFDDWLAKPIPLGDLKAKLHRIKEEATSSVVQQ